jgi:hypothetical protein
MRSALNAERRTAVRARVFLDLEPSDVERVDAFADELGVATRAGALRVLVRRALKAEPSAIIPQRQAAE